jgi:hypothetical protein
MFDKDLITVLKNFSRINLNVLFEKGTLLRTVALDAGMYAEVELDDEITEEAPIYDLQKFLNALSLVGADENLNVDFSNEMIVLENRDKKVFYRCADKQTLELPPKGRLDIPSKDDGLNFTISAETLNYITSACNSFQLSDVLFETIDGELFMKSVDEDDLLKNKFQAKLIDTTEKVSSSIKFNRFIISPDDYDCILVIDDNGGILYMEGQNLKIKYWITCN